MLHIIRQWRRRRLLRRHPVSPALWQEATRDMPMLHGLSSEDLARLRDFCVLFLLGKNITGAAGLDVTDAMRLRVAVQACLPILQLDPAWYDNWVSIVLYPGGFVPEREFTDDAGLVHSHRTAHLGEAWSTGPVILSWADVASGGHLEGFNVVIHEFAHKLDMRNGEVNGHPPLHRGMDGATWRRVFMEAYLDFCRRVDHHLPSEIDPYAAENPGEFFAVLSEYFFSAPDVLHEEYPAVYGQLRLFYRQDPLQRIAPLLVPAGHPPH